MSTPNEKELFALENFRVRLADLCLRGERNTDEFLLNWLRARDLNVNAAETMLRNSLAWRTKTNADIIMEWSVPSHLLEEFPSEISGYDNEGSLVVIIPYGRYDIRTAIENGNKDLFAKYMNRLFEDVVHVMRQKPDTPNKCIAIVDVEGLSFRQLTSVASSSPVDTSLETLKRFEANYPETLKQAYIINASKAFTVLFGLIKPFLSARTLGKIEIHSTDVAKWKSVLCDKIPANQLPFYFGGSKLSSMQFYNQEVSQDPNGKKIISRRMSVWSEEEALIAVTVEAGKTLKLEYDVIQPSSSLLLSWSFKTDDHDIGFSVVLNENIVLIPQSRVESHITMQNGSVTCDKNGRYTLCFDNTYSRVRAKTLHYSIMFCEPESSDL